MYGYRYCSIAGRFKIDRGHKLYRSTWELYFCKLKDDRGAKLLSSLDCTDDMLDAQAVEGAYSIVTGIGVVKDFMKWYKHSFSCFL
jgi:hypothetical protein